ncbi:MAG: hypothetical protein HC806_07590 [Anaerolineae bacterium]|nr:hypothetical protein [Anaerolineae bacterium]
MTELLKRKNEELEKFAYIASHDLKAPMRAITSLTEWITSDLKKQKLESETKDHLDLLNNRAKRMTELIDGILEYSRIGRFNFSEEIVDLQEVIDDITKIYPDVTWHIDKLPEIKFNKTRISQVFGNLIENGR